MKVENVNRLFKVRDLVKHITLSIFNIKPHIIVEFDKTYPETRIYLQVLYNAPCTKTGEVQEWSGRKWYVSDYMTEDEIVKTAWCAFEAAVKHEVMEGFKFDGVIVFNPHVNFRALLGVSHMEVKRESIEKGNETENVEDCVNSGQHLNSCDDDGYCNICGFL